MSVYFLEFFFRRQKEKLCVDTEVLKTSFWAPTKSNLRRNHRVSNSPLPNDINDQSRDIRSLWTLCRANEMLSNESRRRHPSLRRLFEKKCSSKAHICSFWRKTHLCHLDDKRRRKDRACERQERDPTQHSNRNTLRACNSIIVSLSFARSSSPTIAFPPFSFALIPFYAY